MASLADGFSSMGHPPPSPRRDRPTSPLRTRPPTPRSSPRVVSETAPDPDAQKSESARLAEIAAEAWVAGLIALPPPPPPVYFVPAVGVPVDDTVVEMPDDDDIDDSQVTPPGEAK